ncbi:hypothetical protein OCOJLMKI_1157 [Methylobacterium iners]|uniref:Uncharacterized protein n=1 Tax=Methylobacterium iners TaxID=418707 RepID=A0ABQ4RW90_9HYPH|nr:hypothetical protein OCOJLMKI_1157 [Methylobacterium iners]
MRGSGNVHRLETILARFDAGANRTEWTLVAFGFFGLAASATLISLS